MILIELRQRLQSGSNTAGILPPGFPGTYERITSEFRRFSTQAALNVKETAVKMIMEKDF